MISGYEYYRIHTHVKGRRKTKLFHHRCSRYKTLYESKYVLHEQHSTRDDGYHTARRWKSFRTQRDWRLQSIPGKLFISNKKITFKSIKGRYIEIPECMHHQSYAIIVNYKGNIKMKLPYSAISYNKSIVNELENNMINLFAKKISWKN